jgi:hypothetical protein
MNGIGTLGPLKAFCGTVAENVPLPMLVRFAEPVNVTLVPESVAVALSSRLVLVGSA